jgi:hypothetical protein
LTVLQACISDKFDEFHHQIVVVALVQSIDDNHRWRHIGVSRRHNGFDQQFVELEAKRSFDNSPIILKDLLNQWFRGGDRNRKLVSECTDEASGLASSRHLEEETGGKPVLIMAYFSDGL